MKPSEQLTDEQRKRVREIAEASAIQFGAKEGDMFILGGGSQEDIERAILQALDEIGAEWVKNPIWLLGHATTRITVPQGANSEVFSRLMDNAKHEVAHQLAQYVPGDWSYVKGEQVIVASAGLVSYRAAIDQER